MRSIDPKALAGIERDPLEPDGKFMRHPAQVVRNGLGDRAGTCIDPKCQVVEGETVCAVSCQRGPEPVILRWKGLEAPPEGDFFVRSGPATVKLSPESAARYIETRFGKQAPQPAPDRPSQRAGREAAETDGEPLRSARQGKDAVHTRPSRRSRRSW